jgi:hypothetical protein
MCILSIIYDKKMLVSIPVPVCRVSLPYTGLEIEKQTVAIVSSSTNSICHKITSEAHIIEKVEKYF